MKQVVCDIRACEKPAKNYEVDYLKVEIVPTGNSDYSAYEEKTVKRGSFDLCETHAELYDSRIAKVLVKDEKGLRFPR